MLWILFPCVAMAFRGTLDNFCKPVPLHTALGKYWESSHVRKGRFLYPLGETEHTLQTPHKPQVCVLFDAHSHKVCAYFPPFLLLIAPGVCCEGPCVGLGLTNQSLLCLV